MNKSTWDSLKVHEQLAIAVANARMLKLRGDDNPSYLTDLLNSRTDGHPYQNGSYFTRAFLTRDDGVVESLGHRLFMDRLPKWEAYPDCPNLAEGCVAFKMSLSKWCGSHNGGYGIAAVYNILDLEKDVGRYEDTVKLEVFDPKNTGYASFRYHLKDEILGRRIRGLPVEHAVAIVELAEKDRKTGEMVEHDPILATLHPGDPVMPSRIQIGETLKVGQRISIEYARKLGVRYVKFV